MTYLLTVAGIGSLQGSKDKPFPPYEFYPLIESMLQVDNIYTEISKMRYNENYKQFVDMITLYMGSKNANREIFTKKTDGAEIAHASATTGLENMDLSGEGIKTFLELLKQGVQTQFARRNAYNELEKQNLEQVLTPDYANYIGGKIFALNRNMKDILEQMDLKIASN